MRTRRSFLGGTLSWLAWLGAGAGGAWFLREQVFWPAPSDRSIAGPEGSGWLPFAASARGVVTVQATLAGRPVVALVDSGAQYSVVDRAYADSVGLELGLSPPMVAVGVGGGSQIGRGATTSVTLGALTLTALRTAVLALGPITRAVGEDVPLILGQDVLGALVADIDFPGRRIAFRRAEGYVAPDDAEPVAARRVGRALHVDVVVEGRTLDVLVDTGSSSALALTTETARDAGLLDGRPVRGGRSVVLGGVVQGGSVTVAALDFAGETLTDVEAAVFPPVRAPGFPSGLLGVGALRGRRTVFDLSRGRMHRF